jgi:predicted aspartyl protease
METDDMGRVLTEATIYNANEHADAKMGKLTADQVRKVVVTDALVDTGATALSMPKSLIDQLGLAKQYEKRAMTATGLTTINVYGPARVVIMGREAPTDVIELPEGNPVLIGQIPLEWMDWVVDLQGRKLIGNPAHGGEHILELL